MMAQTMTQGNISRILVKFSLPLIFSGVLQQLYNWADAFIVGNVEGELSLAAVGATTSTVNLFLMTVTGVTLGLSILSAQQCGQGRAGENARVLSTFVLVLGGCFSLLSAAGIFLAGLSGGQRHDGGGLCTAGRPGLLRRRGDDCHVRRGAGGGRPGAQVFREISPFYLLYGLSMSSRGFLEGLGDVTFSSAAGIASLAVRIAVSYTAAGRWGTSIIAYAEVLSWSVLLLLCLFRIGRRRPSAAG